MSAQCCPSCGAQTTGTRFCGLCGFDLSRSGALLPVAAVAPITSPALAPGTMLAARYRIDRVVAEGSMGVVYAATDRRSADVPRALKELLAQWDSAEELAEAESWFAREGEIQRGLRHPAIPAVHEAFEHEGRQYLAMDLVEGRSLEQVLAEEGRPGLPEPAVVRWADQVLDVLNYLHTQPHPLIFRDLKPANLMLTPQGTVRLIDFGIARVFTRQAQGTAIGTPGYAPPEQYQGLAEPASDLYALGATMHHLLSGRDPRKHRPFDFPPVRSLAPHVTPHVAAAIDRALVLDPRHRFDVAADLYRALHASVSIYDLPKLTVGTPDRRPAAADPLPHVEPGVLVSLGPLAAPASPDTVSLAVAGQVTFGGVTLVVSPGHRALELHNHTGTALACAVASSVPWLQPDRAAGWLEPHGMLAFDLVAAAAGGTTLPVAGVPAHLQVVGAAHPVSTRLSALPGLVPVSVLAACSAGVVFVTLAFQLGALAFWGLNALSLCLALWLQWRSRRA